MSLTKVTYGITNAPINVFAYGATGNGRDDDSAAFQAAINAAIATTGEVFVPAGEYVLDSTVTIPFVGGVKIYGVSNNSLGTKSRIFQKNIETPAFTVNGINVTMSGLSFTVWSGNITDANGNPITCTSVTSNSMTLSADPWPNQSPVIWNTLTPQISTDGTPYSNVLQIAIGGSFYASGVTKNGDGTVTLTGVKGASGTPNSELANIVGDSIGYFVSLAYAVAAPTNPNAGAIYLAVKENHFYDHLWFNQVTSAFTVSALGSGAGPGVGVGNIGFMSDIVCDQATYFMKGLGNINNLQIVNSQFFGTNVAFYTPFGSLTSSSFSNNSVIIGKFIQANNDIASCTIVGNNFNAVSSGYGYSDNLINIAGTIQDCAIVGNNFGRNSTTYCINATSVIGTTFVGNNILSNGETTTDSWLHLSSTLTDSTLSSNNFAQEYGISSSNRLAFSGATPDVSNSVFGGEWVGYQSGTKVVGWLAPTFQNSWANVGAGTQPVKYFKDQNGVVTIVGQLNGGSAGTVAFTLPAGYRPLGSLRLYGGRANTASGETPLSIDITTSGNVTINTAVISWSDFGNISFPTR